MNKVLLTGRLTRDVEVRFTQGGAAIGGFAVATTRKYKKGEEWVEETAFIDCKAFGAPAENLKKFFKKGSGIELEGRLHMESWDDKNTGHKRSRLLVMVEQWEFPKGNSKREEEGDPDPAPAPRSATKTALSTHGQEKDDVPF